MSKLTHTDQAGQASMVDISDKEITERTAVAVSEVAMQPATLALIKENNMQKGDVLSVARVAGIMAAKNTSNLIPLCHPLALTKVKVEFALNEEKSRIQVICTCKVKHTTGVEMEALTGASVAALTIYDMCKGVEKGIEIKKTRLLTKEGGKSGSWQAST